MSTSASPPAPPEARPPRPRRPEHRLLRLGDLLFGASTGGAALAVLALAGLLVVFIAKASLPSIHKFGLSFLTSSAWDVPHLEFGAVPFIWGTLVTSALAMLMAVPVSVAAACYLAEIAPGWMRRTASFLVELLAAIPSVIYGFWGIFFL